MGSQFADGSLFDGSMLDIRRCVSLKIITQPSGPYIGYAYFRYLVPQIVAAVDMNVVLLKASALFFNA